MRSQLVRLLAVPAVVAGLATACTDDAANEPVEQAEEPATEQTAEETEPRGMDQTMVDEEAFFEEPERLIGSRVTFTGQHGTGVGSGAFTLTVGDQEVLVLTPSGGTDVPSGSGVDVAGTVDRLDQALVEDQGLVWSPELERYDGDVVVVAEDVRVVPEVPEQQDQDQASEGG